MGSVVAIILVCVLACLVMAGMAGLIIYLCTNLIKRQMTGYLETVKTVFPDAALDFRLTSQGINFTFHGFLARLEWQKGSSSGRRRSRPPRTFLTVHFPTNGQNSSDAARFSMTLKGMTKPPREQLREHLSVTADNPRLQAMAESDNILLDALGRIYLATGLGPLVCPTTMAVSRSQFNFQVNAYISDKEQLLTLLSCAEKAFERAAELEKMLGTDLPEPPPALHE